MGSHQKLTRLIESHHRIDPDITVREVAEELSVDRSTVVQHLKQIGKVKKLYNWVPHELTEKKNVILKCLLLLFCSVPFYLYSLSHDQLFATPWTVCIPPDSYVHGIL